MKWLPLLVFLLLWILLPGCGDSGSAEERNLRLPDGQAENASDGGARPSDDVPTSRDGSPSDLLVPDTDSDTGNAPTGDTDVVNDDDSASPDQPDASAPDTATGGSDADAPDTGANSPDAAETDTSGSSEPVVFEETVISSQLAGPSFISTGDVDGDGRTDVVVSEFGTMGLGVPVGAVRVFYQGASLEQWTEEVVASTDDGIEFPNHTTIADVDGDGDRDIIVPSGFLVCTAIPFGSACGGLQWFEQSAQGWIRRPILADGQALFYHAALLVDLDDDGIDDIVTTAEENGNAFFGTPGRAELQWLRGLGNGAFSDSPVILAEGGGSLPELFDVDGDGDEDIVSAEFFVAQGSFAWFEKVAGPSVEHPAGRWERHVIDDGVGPSIMVRVLEDAGDVVALGSNHANTAKSPPDPWESGVYLYVAPTDPTQRWQRSLISSGIVSTPGSMFAPMGAPGVFDIDDIDGDGDFDVLLSGDGDNRIFWLQQSSPREFVTHVLASGIAQAGVHAVDLDSDGAPELLVTGYEDNRLRVYARR